jgi:hypothetical protein
MPALLGGAIDYLSPRREAAEQPTQSIILDWRHVNNMACYVSVRQSLRSGVGLLATPAKTGRNPKISQA